MALSIHAIQKPLSKIFSNDYLFSVPPYQRPYAWTRDQASELLGDLLSFLGDGSDSVDELNPYFLGSVVLIKKEEDTPEDHIVDGQQRLTTITLLLSVLRQVLESEERSDLMKFIYEKGDRILGTPNRYRLSLRGRDNEFFRQYVQDEKGIEALFQLDAAQLTDSQRNLQMNAKYFAEILGATPEPKRIRLLQYLMKKCSVVVVSTPDLDSAYRIFSILNARGLDLSLADLLKAEIIGAIPPSERERYTDIWEAEEEDLGRDSFLELFAHIRMIYLKAKLRESAYNEYHTRRDCPEFR